MPALRRLTIARRPETYLAVVFVTICLGAVDCLRPPRSQLTARLYIGAIHLYQRWGRPATAGLVRCRYRPTCSEYSREAVEKYGLPRGLAMSAGRLWRCRSTVPLGTSDPVP